MGAIARMLVDPADPSGDAMHPSLHLLGPTALALALAACSSGKRSTVEPLADLRLPRAHVPRTLAIDVDHYRLDLEVHPEARAIAGTCSIRFHAVAPLERVELDLAGLEVRGVRGLDDAPLDFVHEGGTLSIDLGRTLDPAHPATVHVDYSGTPGKGLYFAGGDVPTHVWTQGECEDARWWFPCIDHPSDRATSEVQVTMPAGWRSVAAGTKWSSEDLGGRRREHWVMRDPHPTYLMTLVAGELVEQRADWGGTPLVYLAPAAYADLLPSLAPTPATLDVFSELTGRRYPFAKYATACVEAFPFGGMENVSATTITTHSLDDPRGCLDDHGPEGLIAHEAAHQWFGDLVTCADWPEIWLNEGFATYLTAMFVQAAHGDEAFLVKMRGIQERAMAGERAESRTMLHATYVDPIDLFFSGHVYQGGAARLHMLRGWLGEAGFRRAVREYLGSHENRAATTEDLRAAFERATGEDLSEFFGIWFEAPGFPEFEVRWRYDVSRSRVLLTVNQVHATTGDVPAVFMAPVDIEVRTPSSVQVHRLRLTKRRDQFELPADARPLWVRFDKGRWLLGERRADKEVDEWVLLANAGNASDRQDALEALARMLPEASSVERKQILALLTERLSGDPVGAIRGVAASQLASLGRSESRTVLAAAALTETDAAALAAILTGLEAFAMDPSVLEVARTVFERADVPRSAQGAALRLAARVDPVAGRAWLLELGDRLPGDSVNGDLGAGAARAWAAVGDATALETLVRWVTDEGTPPVQREVAVTMLAGVPLAEASARDALLALLAHDDPRLRLTTVRALVSNPTPEVRAALRRAYGPDLSPREQRLIEGLFADLSAAP